MKYPRRDCAICPKQGIGINSMEIGSHWICIPCFRRCFYSRMAKRGNNPMWKELLEELDNEKE